MKTEFDQKNCNCNVNLPFLDNLLNHVNKYFDESSFDNEKESKVLFDKILRHIVLKAKKNGNVLFVQQQKGLLSPTLLDNLSLDFS